LFLCLSSVSGCGFLDFACKIHGDFMSILSNIEKTLVPEVRTAFEEAMNETMKEVDHAIYLLDTVGIQLENNLFADFNATIKLFEKSIEQIANYSVHEIIVVVNTTIKEIKDQIIDNFFEQFDQSLQQTYYDVSQLLNKVNEIIGHLSCSEEAMITRISDTIKTGLAIIPNPYDLCRKSLNKEYPHEDWLYKPFSKMTFGQLYLYQKCKIMLTVSSAKSPLSEVEEGARDWEMLAGNMRCVSVALSSPDDVNYYLSEMGMAHQLLETFDFSNATYVHPRRKIARSISSRFMEQPLVAG